MSRNPYTGASSDLGPLFSEPLARTSDPVSSHLAAKEIRESGAHGRLLDEVEASLREYVEMWGRAPTTRELCREVSPTASAEALAGLVHTYGRRLSDLANAGRVNRAGMRLCRVGNRQATTWEPA